MIVFIALLLVPMAIQHFSLNPTNAIAKYDKKNQLALGLFFILLTLLVMLRHETIGNDTRNYIHFFEQYAKMNWQEIATASKEWGFPYFNKLVSLLTKEPQVFLAITAIITVLMIYPTYRRLCTDASLTIMLFCTMSTFVMLFSGIRQMLAIGIGFLAYECTRKKKIILFILCVLLAIMFHTSAFMLVFMYPLYHARITAKWLWVVVPVMTLIFIFNEQIFLFLSIFIKEYTKYDVSITYTGAYAMLILFALFTLFSFWIPDETQLDQETIGLRNFLLFSLALQMFAPLHSLAMRMNYYYIIFVPLLLPKIIHHSSARFNQVAVVARHIMVIFFLFYFIYTIATSESTLNVFPYHFFWENV